MGGAIGGVGQRMLMGVAKKMATQFFAAVDADIAGIRAPATATAAAPAAAAVRVGVPVGLPVDGRPAFQGRALQSDGLHSKDFLYGVLTGAAIAIAGVAVGVAVGRR